MPEPRIRGVISLGTNTSRLLVVADAGAGRIEQLEHRAIGTRLGEGLSEPGLLGEVAIQRTLAAVREFSNVASGYDAELSSIATSAVRRAGNRDAFAQSMRAITGVDLKVISGDEEAAASYAGATYGRERDGKNVAVLDIGGGSTECALGRDGVLQQTVSCEIGSVRLSERFPALMGANAGIESHAAEKAASAAAADVLASLAGFGHVEELRAVAGTATTLAAVAFEESVERVRGRTLTVRIVRGVLDAMLDRSLEQRRGLKGMLAQRADILPAGAIVLLEAMHGLNVEQAVVETNDLLLGYLLRHSEA